MDEKKETPEEYAIRRSRETRVPYLVTHMGHAMMVSRENTRLSREELGGIKAIAYPQKGVCYV